MARHNCAERRAGGIACPVRCDRYPGRSLGLYRRLAIAGFLAAASARASLLARLSEYNRPRIDRLPHLGRLCRSAGKERASVQRAPLPNALQSVVLPASLSSAPFGSA